MATAVRHIRFPAAFAQEPAAPEHIAHFYEDEPQLLRALSSFVAEGLDAGESAIVIATPEHEIALRFWLLEAGIDVAWALAEDRYIPLDAEETLSKFMVNGWPDGQLFADLVGQLMNRAVGNGQRRTRAFGEMVALLWARGQAGATVRLEDLWNQFSRSYSFPLLCAYPIAGFVKGPLSSLGEICAAHSTCVVDDEDTRVWKAPVSAQAAD